MVGSLDGLGRPPRGRPPHMTVGKGPRPPPRKGEAKLPRLVGTRRDCSQPPSEKVTYFLVYLFHAPLGNEYFAQVRTTRLFHEGMYSARFAAPRQFGDTPPARIKTHEHINTAPFVGIGESKGEVTRVKFLSLSCNFW